MAVWIVMLAITLLCPATMLLIGWSFRRNAPAKINRVYGYRTARSMKNSDTWAFAHRVCGKVWLISGAGLALLSVIAMLFCLGRDVDFICWYALAVVGVQVAVMLLSIVPVELALRRNFTEAGKRRR